ncbi:unnamed protein product [Schistocephalus solidus]|uniref:Acetyltransferase n=1 Tax=Schistocephalus solidus TaxID=70667 RepID=A0A183TLS6_SCHSO|nr:unnamed protein product [Schistocephalus solidus]
MNTFRIHRRNREEFMSVDRLQAAVPDTPPDEPCGPLLLHLSDPKFNLPAYYLFPHVLNHQLPPHPTPTLKPRGITNLLLGNLFISSEEVGTVIFLIG